MIVKMKKYTFLVFHKQYQDFLLKLKEQEVLHVSAKPEGIKENDQLRDKMQLASQVDKAIRNTQSVLDKNAQTTSCTTSGQQLMEDYYAQLAQHEKITQDINAIQRDIELMTPWGDYSIERIQQLSDKGYKLSFYSCNERKFNAEWEEKYNAVIVNKIGNILYFVIVNADEKVQIDADPIQLNTNNISKLLATKENLLEALNQQESQFKNWAIASLEGLQRYAIEIEEEIDWTKVQLNTTSTTQDKVMLLEGYCPEESQVELNHFLDKEGIYYESHDPSIHDNIPVKLKNNAFSKLYEPIMNLFSLPNYNEIDITFISAPFFMLFFGLCFGDGGYGLLVLLTTLFVKRRLSKDKKAFANLFIWLSIATMFAGLLTGSFFGIALDKVEWSWLAGVKHLFLTQNNYGDMLDGNDPMMILALVIGLIQIFTGMGLNAAKIVKQHGLKYAWSQLGWLFGLLSLAATYGLPAAGIALPSYVSYPLWGITAISAFMIFLFNNPDGYKKPVTGVLGNIGAGLYATYNTASGLLGDTLSYVRLFALGLTGAILGGVFNSLAFSLTADMNPIVGWILALLILLIGHTINFGLCFISAFVHPIRLTFVEFYKNAGFEGGGKAYAPFKNKLKK